MGLDVSTRIIAGVRLDHRQWCKDITKYNEDTGEAYKALKNCEGFFIFGTDIEINQYDDEYGDIIDKFYQSDYASNSDVLLGNIIYDLDNGVRSSREGELSPRIDPAIMLNEKIIVAKYLKEVFGYDGGVYIFMQSHLSY